MAQRTPDAAEHAGVGHLVDKLEQLGFYRFMPAESIPMAKAKAQKTGSFLSYWDTEGIGDRDYILRQWQIDAEDLAEGGILRFYQELEFLFQLLGVELDGLAQHLSGDGYTISVNDQRYRIYAESDSERTDLWELSSNRALALLNLLLEQEGSNERFYLYGGGNDGFAVLLTPNMYQTIDASGLLTPQHTGDMVLRAVNPLLTETIRE